MYWSRSSLSVQCWGGMYFCFASLFYCHWSPMQVYDHVSPSTEGIWYAPYPHMSELIGTQLHLAHGYVTNNAPVNFILPYNKNEWKYAWQLQHIMQKWHVLLIQTILGSYDETTMGWKNNKILLWMMTNHLINEIGPFDRSMILAKPNESLPPLMYLWACTMHLLR
jgi:hypothetical protein